MSVIAWSLLTPRIASVIADLQRERIDSRADVQDHPVDRTLLVRDVDAGAAIVGRAADLLVADHADDLPRDIRRRARSCPG